MVQTLNLSETRSIYIAHIGELHYVSTTGLLSEITSPEVVIRKLFENSSEATNACKRKCTNLRESHINSSSRVETHSHSNALSAYDDTNTDDKVKTTYAKKKCREGTKSPAEKKANRNQYKKGHREKMSSDQKAKQNQYLKNYRSKMTPDQKAKRVETQKAYRSRKKPIELAISEFHNIASEGPVYMGRYQIGSTD